METIEERVKKIEERNKQVEANKAWETSWSRRILIAVLTYLVISLFLSVVIHLSNPLLNAIVPTIGFMLSTLSIPFFKKMWMKHYAK